eukprot:15359379-Ditylum_brightwellii.AAC.1
MPHMSHKSTPKHKAIKFVISSASSCVKKKNTLKDKCLAKNALLQEEDLCNEMLSNAKDRTRATAATDPASFSLTPLHQS